MPRCLRDVVTGIVSDLRGSDVQAICALGGTGASTGVTGDVNVTRRCIIGLCITRRLDVADVVGLVPSEGVDAPAGPDEDTARRRRDDFFFRME